MKVGCDQFSPEIFNIQKNLDHIINSMIKSAEEGVDLLAFPECALTGYILKEEKDFNLFDINEINEAIQKIKNESLRLNISVIFGTLLYRDAMWYNSCFLATNKGDLYSQDKYHLPNIGADRFVEKGSSPLKVYNINNCKVGIMICYEARFPEMARSLSLLGADIIVNPTNLPEKSIKIIDLVIPTRAIENKVFVLSVNRNGIENEIDFLGRSAVYAPDGTIISKAHEHEDDLIFVDISIDKSRDKKLRFSDDYEHCGVNDIYNDRQSKIYIS